MSLKTLTIRVLSVLMVVYQAPALAGELPGNVRNCTYDPQFLEVWAGNDYSQADVPGATAGKGKERLCTVSLTMAVKYTSLPAGISATFHNKNSGAAVSCLGTVDAGATSVEINLVNPSTCSFGKPKPARPSR